MKNKVFAIVFIFFMIVCFNFEFVSAKGKAPKPDEVEKHEKVDKTSGGGLLNDIFSSGGNFLNQGKASGSSADSFGHKIQEQIFGASGLGLQGIFQLVGNAIFLIVTVILGVKYIFSGVEGKSIVKETLPTFIVGIIFFYLADNLVRFFSGIGNEIQNTTNANTLVNNVWATVAAVVQVLCIAGIVFIGLRYMFADAVKKADIKNQAVMVVLGLMLTLSAIPILNFVINVGKGFLP